LLLTGGFVLAGRFLLMDVLLTMCTTLGLLAAYAGGTAKRRAALWWLAAGVACGTGILAKGPVALVLVVPPLVAATWLSREAFRFRWRDGLLLVGLALVIAAPWYVLVSQRHPEFPETFLLKQNLQRYTTGIDHEEPWWFYIPVLFLGMLPASILFPALALFLAGRNEEMRRLRSPGLGFLTAGWSMPSCCPQSALPRCRLRHSCGGQAKSFRAGPSPDGAHSFWAASRPTWCSVEIVGLEWRSSRLSECSPSRF
jgi:dolichol-phosphate mannosyltransferase